jgi:glycosyltransferase involved in cell wall biosynthesis
LNIALGIYNDPEHYPPTLNAIEYLAEKGYEVHVVYLPFGKKLWNYPSKVQLHPVGKTMSHKEFSQSSFVSKLKTALKFRSKLKFLQRKYKTRFTLLYDAQALVYGSFWNSKSNPIWYHNHDVLEKPAKLRFNLTSLVAVLQSSAFKKVNFFSLPSEERLPYFPNGKPVCILPNYPSLKRYSGVSNQATNTITVIYQGTVSEGHGLELLIEALALQKTSTMEFHIAGNVSKAYQFKLENLAMKLGISDRLHFLGYIAYYDLPRVTGKRHIGLAINEPGSLIYDTGAQSSNKIYEYAAAGLCVLYLGSDHYTKYLNAYSWAFPCALDVKSVSEALAKAIQYVNQGKKESLEDFRHELHFEKVFSKALDQFEAQLS